MSRSADRADGPVLDRDLVRLARAVVGDRQRVGGRGYAAAVRWLCSSVPMVSLSSGARLLPRIHGRAGRPALSAVRTAVAIAASHEHHADAPSRRAPARCRPGKRSWRGCRSPRRTTAQTREQRRRRCRTASCRAPSSAASTAKRAARREPRIARGSLPHGPPVAGLGRGRPGPGSASRARASRRALGGPVERHERQLGDRQAGVELDRHAREVGDLERQRALEARVDEAGGGVDDQPEAAERARLALDPRDDVVGQLDPLLRARRARTRRGGSRTARRRRPRPPRSGSCGGSRRSIAVDAVVVEDAERVAQPQVDRRGLDQRRVPRVDHDAARPRRGGGSCRRRGRR